MALLVIASCQLMVVLDITIVNIALPHIQRSLDFSTTSLSWVVNAYTLTFGGLLLLGGRTGDILGRRRVFIVGVLLFALASLLGGLAQNSGQLLAARALQGVGGAIASPTALALISTTFREGPERNGPSGSSPRCRAGGGAIGLLAGGMLVEWLNWRWVLFVNVPIGLLIALAAPRWIRKSERHPGHFDVTGALTSTAGMVLLVYGFIRAAQDGWRDPLTLASFAAAALVLFGFVLVERRSRQPITPLHMFADRNRAGTYGIMLCLAAAMFGMFFFLTLFVQDVLGFSPLRAGLAFLPVSAVIRDRRRTGLAVPARVRAQTLHGRGWCARCGGPGLADADRRPLHLRGQRPRADAGLQPRHGHGVRVADADGPVERARAGERRGLRPPQRHPAGRRLARSVHPVTVFGTASGNEAEKQVPLFLRQATPAERLRFQRTGELPPPWGDEVSPPVSRRPSSWRAIFAALARADRRQWPSRSAPPTCKRLQGGE
ncbi:MFS transporter [Streptomyces heliomycini]